MNCPNCNSEDVGRVPASGIAEGAMQCQECKWDSENGDPRPASFFSLQPWDRRNVEDEKFDEIRDKVAEIMSVESRKNEVLRAWAESPKDSIEIREEEH